MNTPKSPHGATLNDVLKRLRRIESRLVQLMIHNGLDPYSKTYEGNEAERQQEQEKARNGDH